MGLRAALLAFGCGWLAFALVPARIVQATGGDWSDLPEAPWALGVAALAAAPPLLMGATGRNSWQSRGGGTPIPFDATRRNTLASLHVNARLHGVQTKLCGCCLGPLTKR